MCHLSEMALASGIVLAAAILMVDGAAGASPVVQTKERIVASDHSSVMVPANVVPKNGTSSLGDLRGVEMLTTPETEMAEKRSPEKSALRGKTLRIATFRDWPLSDVRMNKTTNKLYGVGVAFQFVELLREEFGFNYTVVTAEDDTASGVIHMITQAKVDMAATFLPMIYGPGLAYSTRLAMEHWVVLLRRPQESASGSSLLAPFDTRVWILILLSVLIVGPVIYAIMVVRVRLCRGSARLSKVFSLTSCVWFVYGALMRQGSTLNPISDSSRLLFATWWIFITVVTAFYTANLTAFLTLSRFTLPIDGPLDIALKAFHWIGLSGSPIQQIIKMDGGFILLRESMEKGLGRFLNSSDEALIELVREEGLMFIREKRVVDRLLYKDYLKKIDDGIEESQRCTFAVTPESFLSYPLGFVFPANSTLPNLFHPTLVSLVEAGIVDHLMNSDLPKSEICPLNLGNKERQLRNSDLMTTYKAVCIGLLIAAVAFMGEQALWRCLRWNNPKSKQLININTKGMPFERLALQSIFAHKWMRVVRNHKTSEPIRGKKNKSGNIPKRMGALQSGEASVNNMNVLNRREYVQVHHNTADGQGVRKLIPIRAPSAVLFEEILRGQGSQPYLKQNDWKGVLNVI